MRNTKRGMSAYLVALLMLAGVNMAMAQESGCKLDYTAEENSATVYGGSNKPPGPAVIFGDSVLVPSFRVQFVDVGTGKAINPDRISVAYSWDWREYPYPDHPWGVWSTADDIYSCVSTETVVVPEVKVKPRGWYNGIYARFPFGRRPYFSGVTIVINWRNLQHRVTIQPKDVAKFRERTVVMKAKYGGNSIFTY